MQAVGKPDVYVDDHTAGPDSSQSCLGQWYRMCAQGAEEFIVQQHMFLPQSRLFAGNVRHSEGIASVVMQTTLRVNGPGTVIMPPSCPARD